VILRVSRAKTVGASVLLALMGCGAGPPAGARVVSLGGGTPVGVDELRFSSFLQRIVAPAGGSGKLILLNPKTTEMESIAGFSSAAADGGHGHGVTSAYPSAGDAILAIDRDKQFVVLVSAAQKRIVATALVSSTPDYVRYVEATHEAWVTEPSAEQIEVFGVDGTTLTLKATISVPGGPESLEIDDTKGIAYTHLWSGKTVAIVTTTRAVGVPFANGCEGSRGLVLDRARGFVLAGCDEGKLVVMNNAGVILSELGTPRGVDNFAYSTKTKHAYVPTGGGKVIVIAIDDAGKAREVGQFSGGSQCAAADDEGQIWACDPEKGTLTVVKDTY
jgi:hypothetical protein